uniref:CMP/dCMP-type deaminase domain-containing protein n=1 Tax=Globisporangium ultimum (strain ATCC 200006 / CBS 805.95 / DAOM BR144) TaxID=431595 RepID=K3XCG2_GLOUD
MRTAELTPEDEQYLALVEHQRDHEMKRPLLSNFRVLALFAYEDLEGNHKHVIGANCECANIGGALCAERSAICQLQLLPVKRVRKVYIVSDADVCLTPGTLCREFLSSSPLFTRQTPFIMRASNCKPCTTTLEELYPFPSIYDRVGKDDILAYAHAFCENAVSASTEPINGTTASNGDYPAFVALQLQSMSPVEQAVYLAAFNATKYDKHDDLFPIRYAAATLFSDGDIKVTWQHKTLEYGSSLDALSKLIPFIDEKQLGSGTYARFDAQEDKMVPADERAVAQPVFVVQVDQFGILHAPFARVRAFFYEYDFQELIVLVHDQSGKLNRVAMGNLIAESPDCIAASTGAPSS